MTTTDARALDARVHELLTGEAIRCIHATVSPVMPLAMECDTCLPRMAARPMSSLVRCDSCGEEFGTTTLAMARDAWPRYSTGIAAAWLVVEEMERRGWWFHLHPNDDGIYSMYFHKYQEGKLPTGCGETAPLAICRAALAALGEEG